MAIAFGNKTSTSSKTTGATRTLSAAPTVSGSDTVMLLWSFHNDIQSRSLSATYNSQSLGSPLYTDFNNYIQTAVWLVVNPASAAAFVVSGFAPTGEWPNVLMAEYFTGVHQTTPRRDPVSYQKSTSTDPATFGVTNSQTGDVIAFGFGLDDTLVTNGMTQARLSTGTYVLTLHNATDEAAGSLGYIAGGSGTITITWDFVNNVDNGWVGIAISLIPAASGETITINKASITTTAKALVTNAKTFLTLSKTSVVETGKNFTANQKTQINIPDTSILLSGQNFNTNAKTQLTIPKTTVTLTGQNVVGNAKQNFLIEDASIILTGQNVTANQQTNILIEDSSVVLTGQNLNINAKTQLSIQDASIIFTGKDVSTDGTVFVSIGDGSIIFNPKNLYQSSVIKPGVGSIIFNGKPLGVNAETFLTIAKAAITFTGKVFTVASSTMIQILKASIVFIGKSLSLGGVLSSGAANMKHRVLSQLLINKIFIRRRRRKS